MRSWTLGLVLVGLLAGCHARDGAIFLTVATEDGTFLPDVEALLVRVSLDGVAAQPITIDMATGPGSLPPSRSISLRFDPERRGQATITIEALRGGATLATGSTMVELAPERETAANVWLPGSEVLPEDVDLTFVRNDLAMPSTSDLAVADLAVADLASDGPVVANDLASDAATQPSDLANTDVPPPDLAGCTLPAPLPADPGTILYVAEGASGTGTRTSPYGTLAAAVTSVTSGGKAIVLVAGGAYQQVAITGRTIEVRGGYYSGFDCRDAVTKKTTIKTTLWQQPALDAIGSTVTLDGVTLIGSAPSGLGSAVALRATSQSKIVLRDATVRSHLTGFAIPDDVNTVQLEKSSLNALRSVIIAEKAEKNTIAIRTCASGDDGAYYPIALVDSRIELGAGATDYAAAVDSYMCGGANLSLERTVVTSAASPRINELLLAVSSDTGSIQFELANSVLVGANTTNAIYTHGLGTIVTVVASTIVAPVGPGKTAIFMNDGGDLTMLDSIVVAGMPLATAPLSIVSARNVFYGHYADQVTSLLSIAGYRSLYENGAPSSVFSNPQLEGYHLTTGSTAALDKGTCQYWLDIDRQTRPGPSCDIGADER